MIGKYIEEIMKERIVRKMVMGAVLIAGTMCLYSSTPAQSQDKQARKIAAAVADAFGKGQLRQIDRKKLLRGRVKLTIENSIGEPEYEHYSYRSFSAMGGWIRKQERDGLPNKVVWPLVGCRKGVCTFFRDGGILHNQLYLKKVTYGYRNGRLYISGVQLLAG